MVSRKLYDIECEPLSAFCSLGIESKENDRIKLIMKKAVESHQDPVVEVLNSPDMHSTLIPILFDFHTRR